MTTSSGATCDEYVVFSSFVRCQEMGGRNNSAAAGRAAARPGKRLSSKVEGGGGEGNKVEIRLGAIPSKCAEMSFDPLSHDVSSKILPWKQLAGWRRYHIVVMRGPATLHMNDLDAFINKSWELEQQQHKRIRRTGLLSHTQIRLASYSPFGTLGY